MFPRSDRLSGVSCVAALLVVIAVGFSWAQAQQGQDAEKKDGEQKSEFYNAAAAKLKNPEPSDPPTIEAGRELYLTHCANCHGKYGRGDGGDARSGGEPSDFTDDKWDYGSTDGEIFVVIRDGVSSDMAAYKDTLTEKEMWRTVVYIRTFGPKKK